MSHRIRAVRFEPGTNDGPLDCSCGWSGRVVGFDDHKAGRDPTRCPKGHDDWEATVRGKRCRTCHREASRMCKMRKRAQRERERVAA